MRFFFLLFFFLLPFQWALSPAEGFDVAIIRLASLSGVFLWLGASLWRKKFLLPSGGAVLLFLSFLFWATLSMVWAENSTFALRKVFFLLSFAPLFFMLCAWFQEHPEDHLPMVRAYVWGACLAALSGLLEFFAQFLFGVSVVFSVLTKSILPFFLGDTFAATVAAYPSLLVNISGMTLLRASGPFPDPHMFSYYVGMAAPLAFSLYFWDRSWRWLLVGILLLIADLLSFSRGGYIGLMFSIGVVVAGLFWSSLFSLRRALLLCGIIAAVLILGVSTPLGTRFLSSFSSDDGSNTERLRLWQEALVHIGERPLLGVGLGNYPLLVKPGAGYREPIYAHNLFLDIALELGIVGLSLFLGFVGLVARSLFRVFSKTRDQGALFLLASLAVFLGHSFFETPMFSVHVLPALLLILALGVSYKQYEA